MDVLISTDFTETISLTLSPIAISELMKMISRSAYFLACSIGTALHSYINQTSSSDGHLSMWENLCMHATVCLMCAGQSSSAGHAAKSGQFKGQFSWVKYDPTVLKGLLRMIDEALYNPFTTIAISKLLEIISRSAYFLPWKLVTALGPDKPKIGSPQKPLKLRNASIGSSGVGRLQMPNQITLLTGPHAAQLMSWSWNHVQRQILSASMAVVKIPNHSGQQLNQSFTLPPQRNNFHQLILNHWPTHWLSSSTRKLFLSNFPFPPNSVVLHLHLILTNPTLVKHSPISHLSLQPK